MNKRILKIRNKKGLKKVVLMRLIHDTSETFKEGLEAHEMKYFTKHSHNQYSKSFFLCFFQLKKNLALYIC